MAPAATSAPIRALDCGAEYEIYSPGDGALNFLFAQIAQEITDTGEAVIPWAWDEKLVVLLNDALNTYSEELGVDGYFYFTQAALLNPLSEGNPANSPAYRWQFGPTIIFCSATRSVNERATWAQASLEAVLLMPLQSHSLRDDQRVLPIWSASLAPYDYARSSLDDLGSGAVRMTRFPDAETMEQQVRADKAVAADTMGSVILDILESTICLFETSEYHGRLSSGGRAFDGHFLLPLTSQSGHPDETSKFIRDHMCGSDEFDTVAAAIKRIGQITRTRSDLTISYAEARMLGPSVAHQLIREARSPDGRLQRR